MRKQKSSWHVDWDESDLSKFYQFSIFYNSYQVKFYGVLPQD